MARPVFSQLLRRFTETPEIDTTGATLRAGLEAAFEVNSRFSTGNLWSSDDGGERWSRVSGHLPPIAAVRFG